MFISKYEPTPYTSTLPSRDRYRIGLKNILWVAGVESSKPRRGLLPLGQTPGFRRLNPSHPSLLKRKAIYPIPYDFVGESPTVVRAGRRAPTTADRGQPTPESARRSVPGQADRKIVEGFHNRKARECRSEQDRQLRAVEDANPPTGPQWTRACNSSDLPGAPTTWKDDRFAATYRQPFGLIADASKNLKRETAAGTDADGRLSLWVDDGIRTRDIQIHNLAP